jgi:hypothetical protein
MDPRTRHLLPLANRIRTVIPERVQSHLMRKGETAYSDLLQVFHCIEVNTEHWVGVAGDGANGAYEWFVARGETFECSNQGYGDPVIALRDVLAKEAN